MEQALFPTPPALSHRSPVWSAAAAASGVAALGVKLLLGDAWAMAAGTLTAVLAGYAAFLCFFYPRAYGGKWAAAAGLALSAAVVYNAFSRTAYALLWRHTFQLSDNLAVFEDPAREWRISYPPRWTHEEQRADGAVNHVFKPSVLAPALYFSVTSRPNAGTRDLGLLVENFFMNLPKDAETEILEESPLSFPGGLAAYRIVYKEISRRIPLTNEVVFVMEGTRLFVLSAGGQPLWFERNRPFLQRLISSLELTKP